MVRSCETCTNIAIPGIQSLIDSYRGADKESADKVAEAIRRLYSKDKFLISNETNERTISGRLGIYLTAIFPDYDVDCEYNRKGDLPKRLIGLVEKVKTDDLKARTVYPDIIIHRRGTDANNLLVIEVKCGDIKSKAIGDKDIIKLKAYRKQLGYQNALFLLLDESEVFGKWLE
jgi:hypothetical protein